MKALIPAALAVLLVAPLVARAELVITDWQTAGDQALMWDTVSNREWLRLDHTAGLSYQQVGAQLGAGGALSGFTQASALDVGLLFDNAGLVPSYPAPDAAAKLFVSLWGLTTWDEASGYTTVRAITSEWYEEAATLIAAQTASTVVAATGSHYQYVAMVAYGGLVPDRPSWSNTTGTTISGSEARADTGSALWRLRAQDAPATPLPLPGSLSLVALGLLAAAGGSQRRGAR
ncbi:hypothetical protein [Roseateles sp. LKC17W]|uniref:PEP-CTERM sorting domain-containing protein n=1 Tax=Pelomonas margarita TaxID=3299031 RepID=A0ABW7FE58_9BURK